MALKSGDDYRRDARARQIKRETALKERGYSRVVVWVKTEQRTRLREYAAWLSGDAPAPHADTQPEPAEGNSELISLVGEIVAGRLASGTGDGVIASQLNALNVKRPDGLGAWNARAVRDFRQEHELGGPSGQDAKSAQLEGLIREYRDKGLSDAKIAEQLNARGLKTRHGRAWTERNVNERRKAFGIA